MDSETARSAAEWEAIAEAAYARMYEARHPRDDFEDADSAFSRAIAATAANDPALPRLRARHAHVRAVYDSQFRRH